MKVETSRSGAIAIAQVAGRVDSSNAAAFDKELADILIGDAVSLILDFSDLVYLSSAGLRAILLAVKRARGLGGEMAVCSVPAHILEVLEVSGFTRLIKVRPTLDEARAAISS